KPACCSRDSRQLGTCCGLEARARAFSPRVPACFLQALTDCRLASTASATSFTFQPSPSSFTARRRRASKSDDVPRGLIRPSTIDHPARVKFLAHRSIKVWDETGPIQENRDWKPIYHPESPTVKRCCPNGGTWPQKLDSVK